MRLPSASKFGLARKCSYWLSPHAPPKDPYEEGDSARLGNDVHTIAQRIGEGHPNPLAPVEEGRKKEVRELLDEAKAYLDVCKESVDSLPCGERFFELPMAWCAKTRSSRILPSKGHRDYSAKRETEIPGTTDVLVVCEDHVLIRDLKTGFGAKQKDASETDQLRLLALMAARMFGAERAVIELDHLAPDGRYVDRAELDCFQLLEVEDEIDDLYKTIESAQQTPKPGVHCFDGYCYVRSNCPATRATLAAVNRDAVAHLPMVAEITTQEQAARVRVGLRMVEEAKRAWYKELISYVLRNGPVDMGDGVFYGEREREKEDLDLDYEHRSILEGILGPEVVASSVRLTTSKTALLREARAAQTRNKEKRGTGAERCEQAIAALREAGAVSVKTQKRFEEYRVRDESNNNDNEAA